MARSHWGAGAGGGPEETPEGATPGTATVSETRLSEEGFQRWK